MKNILKILDAELAFDVFHTQEYIKRIEFAYNGAEENNKKLK